ncbi:MAG TPA: serine/threonine-protein kinase [Pyrinomonadaceae bacterium]|jgi:serine/threonine protein kinase|nr:serine/threonine-protein kinase [Pyrinomonadaceae bacterium]
MPEAQEYVGEVLDDKYRLEHLLGKGGMGAVYLATHLGTERYVALKLISPQFMRNNEFVERFKREARAAGRLRHPNVVDVTDFGFAEVKAGQVAYLVMEYLDGCTLGDVLAEEKRLPLEWVADILDQVCSAVHEAHQQGIIHRDLKPDNIWLEPNRLGSYRVKVLDFGIAKLGETSAPSPDDDSAATLIDDLSAASALTGAQLETDTLLRTTGDESQTKQFKVKVDGEGVGTILHQPLTNPLLSDHSADEDGTLLFDQGTKSAGRHTAHIATSPQGPALTRVGAIMGTPLYMSPEQCGGGYVDTRSDIYSLGVIAYQMLAGEPPFAGNTSAVMRAHREQNPQHLREREAKIPKRAAGVVMSALSKNPAERPPTAFAFGSALRGQSEGIGTLYRRAFSLYSEYFPKFVKLSLIAHTPVIITNLLMIGLFVLDKYRPHPGGLPLKIAMVSGFVIVGLLQIISYMVSGAVISGVTAVIITQLSAAPLRPVKLRVAFSVLRRRWRAFLKTVIRVTLRIFIGFVLLVIPGFITIIRYSLYAPVVLIEGLEGKAAMKRARELASRSWRTIIIVSIIQFIIPMIVSAFVGRIRIGVDLEKATLAHRIYQQVLGLANIFVVPLISIVPALLYIKMRQLGGEPLSAALAQIEEAEAKQSAWQERMRTRLSLHTPTSQRTTTG